MMDIYAVHDLLVTANKNADNLKLNGILGQALREVEGMIVAEAPPMLDQERKIQAKLSRIRAYRDRTGVSMTMAHAVINYEFRNSGGDRSNHDYDI